MERTASKRFAYPVLSLFEDPYVSPVNSGCHSVHLLSNTCNSSNDSKVPLNLALIYLIIIRSSNHIKKTPVTRYDDFLWEN